MMVKHCVGRIKHTVSFVSDFQAQVDVVKRHRKRLFVESAYLVKNRRADHETGSGDGAHIADDIRKVEVMLAVSRQSLERVSAVLIEAHHDARVLDSTVRIQQFRAHRTNLGAARKFNHRCKPLRTDHGGIVIQKEQKRRFAMTCSFVIYYRIIKRLISPVEIPQRRFLFRPFPDQVQNFVFAGIIDNDDFVIRVLGLGKQAVQIVLEHRDLAAGSDDNANRRGFRMQVADAPAAGNNTGYYFRRDSAAVKFLLNRAPRRVCRVAFLIRGTGG